MAKVYPQSVRDQVVQEVREVPNAALVARRHELREQLVQQWVRQAARAGRFPIPDPATVAALTGPRARIATSRNCWGRRIWRLPSSGTS